jgi:hypothetical protein
MLQSSHQQLLHSPSSSFCFKQIGTTSSGIRWEEHHQHPSMAIELLHDKSIMTASFPMHEKTNCNNDTDRKQAKDIKQHLLAEFDSI